MEITRITFEKQDITDKSLAVCSIVLDDCLKLSNIKLFKNSTGFYLCLPSKQDVYQEVEEVNPCVVIKRPERNNRNGKNYEEFYNPVVSSFYKMLLDSITREYTALKKK